MTATPRLRALRVVGFKSFAERTLVEFGAGISAVVGPNGSGKSNLADALRWALGEQGRSLRTRKAEDVIFAGSARRRATGMADVTLVIDNRDRLLPLDYAEVELGRRLYRSGENEYLLNRTRVRLREVTELLEAGNLADNAFLFIGQGMVDQALALRPEERRPLFEEAAGVRRHDRRRRQAEAELAEAEANLARVRDIVTELKPQARRLAAQAEQQVARSAAAADLAEALVAAGRGRWIAGHEAASHARQVLAESRAEADAALHALRAAEERVRERTASLMERDRLERDRREALDGLRRRTTELRLDEATLSSELAAARRDRERVTTERAAVELRIEAARRELAAPPPEIDDDAETALRELESELEDAMEALLAARAVRTESAEGEAAVRRAIAGEQAELARLRRRAADADRLAADQRLRAEQARAATEDVERRHHEGEAEVVAAVEGERAADTAVEDARRRAEAAERELRDAHDHASRVAAAHAAARARLDALERQLDDDRGRTFRETAARHGGRWLADGLEVDPRYLKAVEAALGDALSAVAVDEQAVADLQHERGVVALPRPASGTESGARGVVDRARGAGGGRLAEAIGRDPTGLVGRLLATAVWVPDVASALALREDLPAGWRAVTVGGDVVGGDGIVRLGTVGSVLEAREERDRLVSEIERLDAESREAEQVAAQRVDAVTEARATWASCRAAVERSRRERRSAEEAERATGRALEAAIRELAWEDAQRARLEAEARRAREALEAAVTSAAAGHPDTAASGSRDDRRRHPGLAPLERRVDSLRRRQEEMSRAVAARAEGRRRAEDRRRRAEVMLALDERRIVDLDGELRRILGEEERVTGELEALAERLAAARAAEAEVEAELSRLAETVAAEQSRLRDAERRVSAAADRLRDAETRERSADVAEVEARLQLENIREGLLVELAAIGREGLDALEASAATRPPLAQRDGADAQPRAADEEARPKQAAGIEDEAVPEGLEAALLRATEAWTEVPSDSVTAPSAGRIATLRRRYQELGAANPFAREEYEGLRERLSDLERQQADLESAIAATRDLIADLGRMITERFMATFALLESAFARRFQELFGGGEAQLALTAPDDLTATGVEILARPPGKKRQPLAMLSGGERALTAVALLFAMLEVRPVPFCVLDEVDAALDEANIGRFATALRSLAERIQFVVITHNRGTIEAADALYGVTIGDDAVSRVVSLRLSDASAGDGRRAGDEAAAALVPALDAVGSAGAPAARQG